ncbi:MAG TPA: malto-oligosyltrehalose synthase, partial [Kofleriaceae bacterium]|nr:malto-oligosyltrehalose synthase [Kofleriaceae bacterium]
LARSLHEVDRLSSFFTIINQDPVISRVKLIAEPWDVGEGGYQVGGFPVGWSEWNGKYRDALREFWRGDSGKASEVGYRISGSADLYQNDGRTPSSSINLITAHDGFTLRDLVSYNHKHNEANGENNQDGSNNDGSWNCGHEGETDDPEIVRLRWRQIRNFLGTLLLSQGTPMIVGGDELGRTQRGNNNAYCQDNEISWYDWDLDDDGEPIHDDDLLLLLSSDQDAVEFKLPTFRRAGFFRGRPVRGADVHDIVWLRHDGEPMGDAEWQDPMTSSFAMYVAGSGVDRVDERGRPMADDDFLLAMNASSTDLNLQLPVLGDRAASQPWELVIDTCDDHARETKNAGETTPLRARSLKVYSRAAASKASIQSVTGAPVSTYRLQLHKDFTFAQAADIIGYLAGLGVAAIYTSPYTHAEQGSTHGYNVVDHAALNPELGPDDHVRFVDAIQQHQLGHVLDFVPNHVGIGSGENTWWIDVLENGPASLYADYFDIDWRPPTLGLTNKLLLPTLGKQFGEALEAGELSVVRDGGRFFVAYYDRRWPVAPRTYRAVLHLALDALELPKLDPARQELESILFALDHIPEASQTEESKREERAREKEIVKRRVAELCNTSDVVRETIDRVLAAKNPKDGATGDIEWLEAFLRDQNYRLAYWRVATEEINYRRFFDINELAAIRMEDPRVFDATHALVLDLVARGAVTGLRLDHTDGLYEPAAYFRKLQSALRDALRKAGKQPKGHVYVVAEKILEPGEELPRSWDIAGTSGYDFIAAINGLWVDPCAEEPMTELYARLTGITTDFAEMVYDAKRLIMETSLSSETIMLGQALRRISESGRRSRDFTLTALTTAITDTIAAFPVYRSYVAPDGSREPRDERHIAHAIDLAKAKRRGTIDPSVYDYLHDVLTLRVRSPEAIHFAMRFQQLTGPVMAKGIEDTAMYRYYRLISNNEVGCDPAGFAGSPAQFHAHNAEMLAAFPLTMTTTTTHDTKRSEDVRTRIAALSEIVEEWATTSTQWIERLANAGASPNDVYLLVQTVIGAWPFAGEDPTLQERVSAYMVKAAREAKLHTSWTRPDAGYEQALAATVAQLFHDEALLGEVARLARRLAPAGACNSIAQVALKLASPGVADTYQGTELWDLSLVDPDNRRPVDYESRRALASALAKAGTPSPDLARELVDTYADGRIKLHVTRTGLAMRRADPLLFLEGGYRPLDAGEHVVAFERSRSDQRLVCIVPRLPIKLSRGTADWPLGSVWENHTITLGAGTRWRNAFTGEQHEGSSLALADVLATFPVAWLVSS